MQEQKAYTKFLWRVFLVAACGFALPYAVSEGLKHWFGELPPAQVAEAQLASKRTLFLSGLDQRVTQYKLELAARQNANIIVVGSSRALQVRDFFFNDSLVNWGLAVSGIAALDWSASEIARLPHKPKMAIFFFDPWWFNPNFDTGRDEFTPAEPRITNIYKNAYLLGKRLFSAKPLTRPFRLGVGAIDSNQGFDYYGSFHYISRITVGEPYDVRFSRTLRQIDTQNQRWIGGDEPNPIAIERWKRAKAKLESSGVTVIELFPPFPPSVIDRIRRHGKHAYIGKISERMHLQDVDYMDARTLPHATDCEFIDGTHGGEVVYAKALLKAAERKPALRAALRVEELRAWVKANQGNTSPATVALYANGALEIDFLKLGCTKTAPQMEQFMKTGKN